MSIRIQNNLLLFYFTQFKTHCMGNNRRNNFSKLVLVWDILVPLNVFRCSGNHITGNSLVWDQVIGVVVWRIIIKHYIHDFFLILLAGYTTFTDRIQSSKWCMLCINVENVLWCQPIFSSSSVFMNLLLLLHYSTLWLACHNMT